MYICVKGSWMCRNCLGGEWLALVLQLIAFRRLGELSEFMGISDVLMQGATMKKNHFTSSIAFEQAPKNRFTI